MKIIVDGKQAVMKKGSSFEYHSENPLFTEAEDYSFDIEFPMKDCPQNILIFGALHVKGIDIGKVSFPCEIITENFNKKGVLAIIEVNESCVKGQFLEGASSENFTDSLGSILLTDLDFSAYDGSDGTEVSAERVMGSGWDSFAVWDKKGERVIYSKEYVSPYGYKWQRHIYLYKLVELVALVCGYSLDDADLKAISMYNLVMVVNTTLSPYKFLNNGSGYAHLENSLPKWSVKQFFEEVAKFFGCYVSIDSKENKVAFKKLSRFLQDSSSSKVNLIVNDDFEVELNEEDSKFRGAKKYKLADACNEGNLNMCPFYDELVGLIWYNLWRTMSAADFKDVIYAASGRYDDPDPWQSARDLRWWKGFPIKITDNDAKVVITKQEVYDENGSNTRTFVEYEVVNQFGNFVEGEELGITPCPMEIKRLWQIPTATGEKQSTAAGSITKWYKFPIIEMPTTIAEEMRSGVFEYSGSVAEQIAEGDRSIRSYYDRLWVILNSSHYNERGQRLHTRRYEALSHDEYDDFVVSNYSGEVPSSYAQFSDYTYNLSPVDSQIQSNLALPKVDESKLYRYKFLSKMLPDPKAIYVIKGKEYACLRLTAHFTVDGMSDLIEGEFYEIVG